MIICSGIANQPMIQIPQKIKGEILLIGQSGAGKTAILNYLIDGKLASAGTEIGLVSIRRKTFDVNPIAYQISFKEISGVDKYYQILPFYIKNINCLVLVYDCQNKYSLQILQQWNNQYEKYRTQKSPNVPKIVVGNKMDVEDKQITFEQAQLMAQKLNALQLQVSSLTGQNLDTLLSHLLSIVQQSVKI